MSEPQPNTEIDTTIALAEKVGASIDGLMAENKRLLAFAEKVVADMWEGPGDVDGGSVQDWAEKYQLITPHVASQQDVDDGLECEVGDTIYKWSPWVKHAFKRAGLED